MLSIHGTGIGGGVTVGRARVLESRRFDVARYHVPVAGVDIEVARLDAALSEVKQGLRSLVEHLPGDAPTEARALVEVQAMILDDPLLCEAARQQIVQEEEKWERKQQNKIEYVVMGINKPEIGW